MKRRNLFHAAWAAIVGLFCGQAPCAKPSRELQFRVRVDGADRAVRSFRELSAKLKEVAAERDEWFAEWDAATDAEHYLMDGYIVKVAPRADEDGWDGMCVTLGCFAWGATKADALEDVRQGSASIIEWHLDEDVPLPAKDIDTKRLPSAWALIDHPVPAEYAVEQLYAKIDDDPGWFKSREEQ